MGKIDLSKHKAWNPNRYDSEFLGTIGGIRGASRAHHGLTLEYALHNRASLNEGLEYSGGGGFDNRDGKSYGYKSFRQS